MTRSYDHDEKIAIEEVALDAIRIYEQATKQAAK